MVGEYLQFHHEGCDFRSRGGHFNIRSCISICMFLAHIAIACFGKIKARDVPFWSLLLSSMWLDLFALPGILNPNSPLAAPYWSHGLTMGLIWSGIIGFLARVILKTNPKGFFFGFMVFSHWLLDFVAWPMNFGGVSVGLPLFFKGSPEIGLGLYSTPVGSIIGEAIGLIALILGWVRLKKASPR